MSAPHYRSVAGTTIFRPIRRADRELLGGGGEKEGAGRCRAVLPQGDWRYAANMTLQELVNQAASLYADRKAVWFDECNDKPPTFYTYATVVKLAMELTAFLQKHCDQQGKCEIGLYCYPGINLPSWILGILQVPAAYSPVDPDAPPMLSTYFMKKSNLQYILVENDKINKFQMSHVGWFYHSSSTVGHIGLTLFQLSSSNTELNEQVDNVKSKYEPFKAVGDSQPGYTACPGQTEVKTSEGGNMDVGQKYSLAYVLHTSGTTGIPKIVRVPHKCIVPNIQHLKSVFEITRDDMLFLASPLTFDPSVVELFIALASGASILIVPNTIKMMPVELSAALFHRHRVTVLQATPTLLRRFGAHIIKSTVLSANTSLRVLALGGEAFPMLNLLKSWKHKENKTSIFNLYGITEVSSWATCYKIPEEVFSADFRTDFPIPLGSPLLGTKVEVRDTNGSAVLEGEGQVFIGGEERICFLDDEVTVPLGTMRETGDFVRVQNAKLFFLGRKDNQIKRHGKRFNIESLQQAAEDICKVEACAVTWYQQEKLILFVVPKDDLEKRETLKELQKHLPAYAVPDELVLIKALPLTSHGKVDISELNKIYQNHLSSRRRDSKLSGAEELWERLQNLWKSLLGLPGDSTGISKDAIFLYSGGDSLKALRFYDEIEMLVGKAVPGLLEVILSGSIEEAIDLNLGEIKWEKNLGDRIESSACVSKCGNFIIVGCYDGLVYVLQSSDGEIHWTFVTADTVKSSAVVDPSSGLVYVGSHDQHVYALDIYKKACTWKLHCEGGAVFSSPCLSSFPHHLYVATLGGLLLAVNPVTGNKIWKSCLGKPLFSSPHCNEKYVCVGCVDGNLYCYTHSGEKVWQFSTNGPVFSSPCISSLTKQEIFFGSHDCFIYCCNMEGNLLWKFEATSSVCGTPFVFQSDDLKNKILLAAVSTDGKVWILNAKTGTAEGVDKLPGEVFSSPVVWGTKLVVGCRNDYVYCLDLYITGKKNS
ncbi:acyl-CoA synthetase family member 4 isoform B [Patagioenas fasciata monilis]|uniref:Beta-alanine-activating enzyme n=1 Tax=Patagioenas fasciata monilis TaxID=372326 RepID=A0A1V4JG37_PATFA|nr:acyl-CoA synthetase family member 4 isoform B [Patagioenas fasciata monilis]